MPMKEGRVLLSIVVFVIIFSGIVTCIAKWHKFIRMVQGYLRHHFKREIISLSDKNV